MNVSLTIPINTDDGRPIAEFYVVLDVFVTAPARLATSAGRVWIMPPDGPEWEIDDMFLELGHYCLRPGRKPLFISERAEIPAFLKPLVDDYIASRDGQSAIADQVREE
ncbi:MAG: hypothetical protein ACR2PS_00265 [Pseudomonadales bacterium]